MSDDPAALRAESEHVACRHTPCPSGYLAWHAWAEEKAKTHGQDRCPHCGAWSVWKPKR